jgi:uncharacterized protein YvpB
VESLQVAQQETDRLLVALDETVALLEQHASTHQGDDLFLQLQDLRAELERVRDPERIDELSLALEDLQVTLADLKAEVDTQLAQVDKTETMSPALSTAKLTVDRQQQRHNLSCESSAASMAAQFHGVALAEDEILAALPLDENPNLGFRGNVDGPTGGVQDYGVYAGPILDVLLGKGLQARLVKAGIEGIKQAIVRGNPVIAWITYNCWQSEPTTTNIAGQTVTLVPYQHAVVVTGFDSNGFWANDPQDGKEDYYSLADFERAFGYFGEMAIEVGAP